MTPTARRRVRLAALAAGVTLGATACVPPWSSQNHGTQDAGIGRIDNSQAEVITFPDSFANVATKCDNHGHRVYVTRQDSGTRIMQVIADPTCPGGITTAGPAK